MNLKKMSLLLVASSVLLTTESFAKFSTFQPQPANEENKKVLFKRPQNVSDSNKSGATRTFSRANSRNRQSMGGSSRPIAPRKRSLSTAPPRAHSAR